MPNAVNGLFYGGGFDQLWRQAVAAGAVMIYSFVVAFIIAFAIKKTMGIRISPEEEESGHRRGVPPRSVVRAGRLPDPSPGRRGTTRPRRPVWSARCFPS